MPRYTFPTGITGLRYGFNFPEGDQARTELYIDLADGPKNKALFDSLLAERLDIERVFGHALEWERLDDRRASRIATYRPGSIDSDSEQLEQIRNWAIEQLLKFKDVFGPRLRAHLEHVERASAAQPPAAADAPQVARR